ncbi:hypothetical protein ACFOY4_10410 [Actinomadura syzygii]|uniref:Uncharacterized protein n=1 Tax=Actinomadura syzygii TaxID=1427538 RepID=A0A5D0UCH6_9ACTN|nr:hypothetical protein [Actinomadura syzygii]TYC15787.1 hypothetical protein FXF65_10560 [Actinomadura syzygii]
MSGDGLLVLGIVALAIFTGVHWGRARRAVTDTRSSRQRMSDLRQAVARERTQSAMVTVVAVVAMFVLVTYR